MIRVGVTGGIGSGKSTFCRFWEEKGVDIVYADDLARHIMTNDNKLVAAIKEAFGDEAYQEDGSLNRAYLAEEAFKKERVSELNAIVHPALRKKVRELADQAEQNGQQIFTYEAAILLNEGRPEDLDYVILLQAAENNRISRTVERDDSDEHAVTGRIRKQPDFDSLVHLCDFLVQNDSDLADLRKKALEILDYLRNMHS